MVRKDQRGRSEVEQFYTDLNISYLQKGFINTFDRTSISSSDNLYILRLRGEGASDQGLDLIKTPNCDPGGMFSSVSNSVEKFVCGERPNEAGGGGDLYLGIRGGRCRTTSWEGRGLEGQSKPRGFVV